MEIKQAESIGAPASRARAQNVDIDLWRQVQRIVYPRRSASENLPFAADGCGPRRRPASWLYHLLSTDADLRRQMLTA